MAWEEFSHSLDQERSVADRGVPLSRTSPVHEVSGAALTHCSDGAIKAAPARLTKRLSCKYWNLKAGAGN
jgi:hypothetical protein